MRPSASEAGPLLLCVSVRRWVYRGSLPLCSGWWPHRCRSNAMTFAKGPAVIGGDLLAALCVVAARSLQTHAPADAASR